MTRAESPTEPLPPGAGIRFLRIFGVCGLAFAQPLLDVLGSGVAFFVTHDATRAEVLLVVAAILLVPAVGLSAAVEVVRIRSARAADLAMAVVFGSLVGVTVVSAVDRANALWLWLYALLVAVVALAAGLGYRRLAPLRTFSTFLSPAPLLFAGVFLFASPASGLVLGDDPEALAAGGIRDHDVVMVIFDELPLGALLEPSGEIDAERFPGFARLAETSVWYPEATSVAPQTTAAVPALLTGRYPEGEGDRDAVPLASEHPHSLFTMLASTHEMHVHEWVTQLCPPRLCEDPDRDASRTRGERSGGMLRDLTVVAGHQVLPERLAQRLLPDIAGRWAGFADEGPEIALDGEETEAPRRQDMDRTPFAEALADLDGASSPQVWFAHERLPHRPMTRLPGDLEYPRGFDFDWRSNLRDDASMAYRQQFLLQVQHVDGLVDRLLDRIEAEGLDDAMLVVTSDHGLSFQPHGSPRAMVTESLSELSDVLPVPLFVRYPGQESGEVDHREAQVIDVVPTIAEVLDVRLTSDWRFDGRSLLAEAELEPRPLFWQPMGELPPELSRIDATQFARESHELFGRGGEPHDLYAMGPHRDLVGREPIVGEAVPGARVEPLRPEAYHDLHRDSGVVPALYEATLSGVGPGRWVAVVVNGVVAGTGPVIDAGGEEARVKVMIDPASLRDGPNDVEAHLIDGDAATLRPLAQ